MRGGKSRGSEVGALLPRSKPTKPYPNRTGFERPISTVLHLSGPSLAHPKADKTVRKWSILEAPAKSKGEGREPGRGRQDGLATFGRFWPLLAGFGRGSGRAPRRPLRVGSSFVVDGQADPAAGDELRLEFPKAGRKCDKCPPSAERAAVCRGAATGLRNATQGGHGR